MTYLDSKHAAPMPDFVIIGAMKSGTTSLYTYLCRHPDIFMPRVKEPQFFSRDYVYARGLDWYQQLFDKAGEDQVCGEASTCYSRWPVYPNAADRMAEVIPEVRLIYILRHPVDRLYSHYKHEMRIRFMRGEKDFPTFGEFITDDEEARCASRYSVQLQHLYKYFDKSQICVVLLDDLKTKPKEVLDCVQTFIGVKCIDLAACGEIQANSADMGVDERIPAGMSKHITGRLRNMPVMKDLIDLLPISLRRKARVIIEERMVRSKFGYRQSTEFKQRIVLMSPELRKCLCEEYAEEVRYVEALLQHDLGWWKE